MKPHYILLAVLLILPISSISLGKTYNTPQIDGTVSVGPNDWDADEFLLDDPNEDSRYHEADIDDIYVTWDADYFYLGVKTNLAPGGYGNGYVTFIDTDAQDAGITGATDFTSASFYARRVNFDGMGAEIVVGGWSFQTDFDVQYCSDPANTQPVPGFTSAYNPGMRTFEVRIPWSSIYPDAGGTVSPGASMRIVAVSVGGDNSGAYDAAPSSSNDADGDGIPDESDPSVAWDAYTELNEFLAFTVDGNRDGLPDENFPAQGFISGVVALSDLDDVGATVTLGAYLDGQIAATKQVSISDPAGTPYILERLADGTYDLEADAPSYRVERQENIIISEGIGVENIDFMLTRVPGAIIGTIAVEGPPSDATVYALDAVTGEVGGDGVKTVPGGTGSFRILAVEDGTYDLVAEAKGYVRFGSTVTIANDTSTVDVVLPKAVATRYVFIDTLGNEIYSETISRSLIPHPDSADADSIIDYADLIFEPRDDEGNVAAFDDEALDSVVLSATLLDPSVEPRGKVFFADTAGDSIPDAVLTPDMFTDGRGRFWVRDDSVEVLRVQVTRHQVKGAIEVGVVDLRPAHVGLTVDKDEIAVGGEERINIAVQLRDASGNPAPTPDVSIRFTTLAGSPIFGTEVGVTDANGYFTTQLYGFVAGPVEFTAQVEPGEYAGLPADVVEVTFLAGPAEQLTSVVEPRAVKPGGEADLKFQLRDSYGNPVKQQSLAIDLVISPSGLLESIETPVFTDTSGQAVSHLVAGDRFGLVTIDPVSDYAAEKVQLAIDARLVSVDEAAPESDPDHNSDAGLDLTTMFAWVERDSLVVAIDLASTWGDVHLMVALETKNDAAGGDRDPFEFQVFYRHAFRPDYIFTYKYSAEDYADLRRWSDGWEFWYLDRGEWSADPEGEGNKNALGIVDRDDNQVSFKFPLGAIGEILPGDTLRLQSYVTQEPFGTKYNALDSNPHDDTNDMEPDQGDWRETATDSTYLSNWAEYVIPVAGKAPGLADPGVEPAVVSPGDRVNFSVAVEDSGGGIGDVYVDLSSIGAESAVWLTDDGTGGDDEAGDGVYSVDFTIPDVVAQGTYTPTFTARDSLNVNKNRATASFEIVNPPEVIFSVDDDLGDDHGPNIRNTDGSPRDGLWYEYPTNGIFYKGTAADDPQYPGEDSFIKGVFDLQKVDFMIDGGFLVIRVYAYVPSSEEVPWNAPYPGVTCTNPNKADLNQQKIDIYIDTKERSGATAGLPFRFVDIARSDAWEYAVAVEGWWRGLIASNGENSISFWTIKRQTDEIDFCNDYVANYIDVKIALSELGDPSVDDIKKWDFIITMASHDGNSDDQNLGASRWVNNATSEWQFGNGRDGEAGRERDANIIDVVTRMGEGPNKEPGRTQHEMLDYLTEDAMLRFDSGLTACVLEATSSEDLSPPRIRPFVTDGFAHAVWYVLDYAAASFWTLIEDEGAVQQADFMWRPLGAGTWNTAELVNIVEGYWIADIRPDELRAMVSPITLVDGTLARPFEAIIRAIDDSGNEARTPLITFAVPDENLTEQTVAGVGPGEIVVFYDGTIMSVPEPEGAAQYDSLDLKIVPLPALGAGAVDLANLRSSMAYREVGRRLEITGYKGDSPFAITTFDDPARLALHYPAYMISPTGEESTVGIDEKRIGLFQYNDVTERWIGLFGSVNEAGNAVAVDIGEAGTYALFSDSRLTYDLDEGLSGAVAEPNPFSPNGDGLYDETHISFFLSREADWVTIEIYDMSGEEVRTIRWQQGLTETGRNAFDIGWDGKDDTGQIVPYGIYVLRLEVRFKVAPFNERQNIAVVVIK